MTMTKEWKRQLNCWYIKQRDTTGSDFAIDWDEWCTLANIASYLLRQLSTIFFCWGQTHLISRKPTCGFLQVASQDLIGLRNFFLFFHFPLANSYLCRFILIPISPAKMSVVEAHCLPCLWSFGIWTQIEVWQRWMCSIFGYISQDQSRSTCESWNCPHTCRLQWLKVTPTFFGPMDMHLFTFLQFQLLRKCHIVHGELWETKAPSVCFLAIREGAKSCVHRSHLSTLHLAVWKQMQFFSGKSVCGNCFLS